MKKDKIATHRNQKGVSLIEVLITVLLMSIGALGVAAMQLTGLKYNSGASVRTQATLLANDLMDRMRANRQLANDKSTFNTNNFEDNTSVLRPSKSCYEEICNSEEMALYDKWAWFEQVSTRLPGGKAFIDFDEVDGQRIYRVQIQWRKVAVETGENEIDQIQEFSFRSAL